MDLSGRLAALERIGPTSTPVVTVYLGTRWADEHQRARVRIFLKNELAQARRASHPRAAPADLDWIEAQGEALLDQTTMPDAGGVALFACEALGLREMLPSRIPFENVFAVGETPLLRPLTELEASAPSTLVVFIDTESARLVTLTRPVRARRSRSGPTSPATTAGAAGRSWRNHGTGATPRTTGRDISRRWWRP